MSTQPGLLRVLQKNEIKPLGSTRVRHVNVRIVAATNKNIQQMILENQFRQDLYYRLSVLPVHLPPLRNRREDIPLLVKYFLDTEAAKADSSEKKVVPEAMQYLVAYTPLFCIRTIHFQAGAGIALVEQSMPGRG